MGREAVSRYALKVQKKKEKKKKKKLGVKTVPVLFDDLGVVE